MSTGWYRFTGGAGNMMLNYCPTNKGLYCGAYYKGWMNGNLPEQSDRNVIRYVDGN